MSPGSSQKLITNIEQFGKLLGKTLNNKTMKSIKAKENIGNTKCRYKFE